MEQIAGIAARQKSEVRKQLAIIEIRNISKSFPGVKALSDVSLSIEEGEVHAIVGENGAGKSTLMKILGGMYQADSGEIFIRGEKQEIHSIQDAMKAGVSVIYQELNLMPELTVAEIAYRLRFETPSHFSTFFRKREGVPPQQYRRERRQPGR